MDLASLTQRVEAYWTARADSFSQLRRRELASTHRQVWCDELTARLRHLPVPSGHTRPRLLDVGCGTGFFTFLLAEAGYDVTGIDLTEAMIEQARSQSAEQAAAVARAGGRVCFAVMDAAARQLPSQAFSAIVCRNLTWNLPDLATVYRRWWELLTPGGVLVNVDADYTHDPHPLVACGPHAALAAGQVADYERLRVELAATQRPRPAWDVALLREAGFTHVEVDTTAWQRLYPATGELSNPTPVFIVSATRPATAS